MISCKIYYIVGDGGELDVLCTVCGLKLGKKEWQKIGWIPVLGQILHCLGYTESGQPRLMKWKKEKSVKGENLWNKAISCQGVIMSLCNYFPFGGNKQTKAKQIGVKVLVMLDAEVL